MVDKWKNGCLFRIRDKSIFRKSTTLFFHDYRRVVSCVYWICKYAWHLKGGESSGMMFYDEKIKLNPAQHTHNLDSRALFFYTPTGPPQSRSRKPGKQRYKGRWTKIRGRERARHQILPKKREKNYALGSRVSIRTQHFFNVHTDTLKQPCVCS